MQKVKKIKKDMEKFQTKLTKKKRHPRPQNQSNSSWKQKTQPRIRKMIRVMMMTTQS